LTTERLTGLGRSKDAQPRQGILILLLLDTHSPHLQRVLQLRGYKVCTANSPDHAVAICAANKIAAVVLDQCLMAEIEGWSLAKSLKMVCSGIAVVLLCHGPMPEKVELPSHVDCVVSDTDMQTVFEALKRCVQERARQQA